MVLMTLYAYHRVLRHCPCHLKQKIGKQSHLLQVIYSHLPNQRKINPAKKVITLELMDLKANKKMIQNKIMNDSGRIITLKDLSNIRTTARKHDSINNIVEVINKLKTKHNCNVEVSTDEANNFNGIFIQDRFIAESIHAFPEVVFADATNKLIDLRLPVYVLVTEDGNGQSEIAEIGLLVNEEEQTLRWFFKRLKNLIQFQLILGDMKERKVIKQVFPEVSLTICLFHTLRTINREITCDKRNVTHDERDSTKEIIQNLVYCKSEFTTTIDARFNGSDMYDL
ncbi:hypothetical protein AGLY_012166 [Aphis glycines]|uniref:ZSWIM1/3 RNaseH-like domain-containing protein n=1 Tax=Aphis glycines TaxID=307491 RepID=A0A6G0TAM8_APHGL|nr:hypothetical protein AGLY_012166 [Aphis glycines]